MQVGEVSSSNVSSIFPKNPSHVETAQMKQAYASTIRSMKSRGHAIGDTLFQMFETFAMFAMFPLLIYTFYIASVSLIFLPFMLIVVPFILIGDFVREMLHTILPWIFSDPRLK